MRKIKHGFLGKTIYENKQEFKEVPPSTEERRRKIREKMNPWKFDPNKVLYAAGKGFAPTPPVETFYLQTAQGDNLQTAQGDNILWTT